MKNEKTKKLVLIAVLGALSAVLMVFRFPLPFMPPFLSFDFAGVPIDRGIYIRAYSSDFDRYR
ncbi:MAG: hypothetical protein V8R64_10950 [Thomasclavelia sp.]